jgi:hypothetical protein
MTCRPTFWGVIDMNVRRSLARWSGVLLVGLLLGAPAPAAENATVPAKRPSERDVARRVDEALTRALDKTVTLPALADDETFLRRASLDLTGQLPSPEEVRDFVANPDPDKRFKQLDCLLASEAYAVNWGRYWRDVLTYHTPASGNYLRWQLWDQWLVEQVQKNRPWGDLVTALVTATGINDECAPVNYLTSHFGNQVEIAATTARVFLGVQLQCAECHHAKTEPWKREQFHEFVAFFGRAKIIQHKDVTGRGTPYAIEGRAEGQYHMTDKKDPSRLLAMTPRFLTGESISPDADDTERRAALARFLTSPKNPWFAKAYVNRMWAALMGWGFYPGLADLGSTTRPRYPEVLDLLAAEWTATGYDMRWLFATLTRTEVYQRRLRPFSASEGQAAASVCPCRLRPEQVFEALVKALGFDENDKTIPAPAPSSAPAVARFIGLRNMVYQAFKVDPSLPADEVQGTIPQALLLMNSALVHGYIVASGQTVLADALNQGLSDDDVVVRLYERTLARKPKSEEMAICRRYLKKVGDRKEALEDIFWSLINSTEFLTKR